MNFTGLRDYQVPHAKALSASLEIERAVLDGSDTGTGKTYVALTICKELDIVPFVITKLGVISGWNEASGAVGCPIEVVNYELVRYQKKMSRKNAAIHFGEMSDKQYERVERSYCKKLPNQWGQLKAVGKGSKWEWHRPPGLIIFDEVQECGGRSTINSKLLLAASRQAGRILSLSATAAESPLQLKALGHAMGLYDNYTTFLRQHACYVNNWNGWAFNPTSPKGKAAMKRIHKSIFPSKGSRMVKASIPGFPATTVSSMHIEDPTGKAEGLCDELKDLHDKYLDRAEEVADEILELEEKIEAALHSGQDESFVHELVKKIEWIRRSKRGEEILRYRQQLLHLLYSSLIHPVLSRERQSPGCRRDLESLWQN